MGSKFKTCTFCGGTSRSSTLAVKTILVGSTPRMGNTAPGYSRLPLRSMEKASYARVNGFQDNIAHGKENDWRCRAGARYLYICEDGLVHYCSQQRGYPGVPLATYTRDDMRREYLTEKSCAPHCTVSCVHQVSVFDGWRAPQHPAPPTPAATSARELVQIK